MLQAVLLFQLVIGYITLLKYNLAQFDIFLGSELLSVHCHANVYCVLGCHC